MWTCARCGEELEDTFDSCWKCAAPSEPPSDLSSQEKETGKCKMRFQHFRGTLISWDDLFQQAADFATEIGPERVVSISHSEDENCGIVTVWYWEK